MNREKIEEIRPDVIKKYSSQFSSLGSDYVFSRLTKTDRFNEFNPHTMRIDDITIVLCLSGSIDINVNLSSVHLEPNMLMIIGSGSIFNVDSVDWDKLDAYVFVTSPDFIRDINFDVNVMTAVNVAPNRQPLFSLTDEEVRLMSRYLDLIHYNTVDNTDARYVRSISRSLVAAAVYQLMQFAATRQVHSDSAAPLSRKANYVKEFMHLVSTHYRCERGIAFYARHLFISPKYLSLIIKEATGRSAAEWIDDLVIMEAKNLLRFSGKNVQQIAYELNFSNQSAFGKYFKHLTGMSPTKFQHS
ncbi:MAG: helix-turn-helix domain-containing protein [Bacteroides sp.]|nr:helix-turn-helix domain-containing protein [Bacteroides sp.]MCM1413533.1 helix-turn-helix domain-containing protein [Bacteroides sp.]MCM1471087.1 helix-turn-helix domain-containing protein [Bacteroides sp.]